MIEIPRTNRIKEYKFAAQNIAADTASSTFYSDYVINGRIVQIEHSFNQGGSLVMTPSGLPAQTLWVKNAASGTNVSVSYPKHFDETTAGTAISGATYSSVSDFCVNDILAVSTGSLTSGTASTLNINVKYI